MKNVRIRLVESCSGDFWWFEIREGKKRLFTSAVGYEREKNAIKYVKAMAKRLRIKYDPKIIKQHGC